MKSKRKFFDSLDERWQEAYRRTVRQWTQIVKKRGWRDEGIGCTLCDEAEIRVDTVGTSRCERCILAKFLGSQCVDQPAWMMFNNADGIIRDEFSAAIHIRAARKTRFKAARTILRQLKDALPKYDEIRLRAERVLKEKK